MTVILIYLICKLKVTEVVIYLFLFLPPYKFLKNVTHLEYVMQIRLNTVQPSEFYLSGF